MTEPARETIDTTATRERDGRRSLIGLARAELEAEVVSLGMAPFRARQIWHWIYNRGATSFDEMTTLSKDLRARLAERYALARPTIGREQHSADGTRK